MTVSKQQQQQQQQQQYESNNDECKMYDDLKSFLQSDRTDLRQAATEACCSVRDFVGMEKLIKHGMVALLAKNTSHEQDQVAINALQALVHLSSNGPSANQCVQDLLEECGGLNRMAEIILSNPFQNSNNNNQKQRWKEKVNYATALVANMTRTEKGAVEIVGKSLPEEPIYRNNNNTIEHTVNDSNNAEQDRKLPTKPLLELMLARFLNADYIEAFDYENTALAEAELDSNASDPYQHFASVLMNATQLEAGRAFLLKIHYKDRKDAQGNSVLQTILPQLKSTNPIRRRGIAGTVRNCCLDTDSAWWFLNVVKITTHILYPLAGPEELDFQEKQGLDPDLWLQGPDKKREPDHMTRLMLVEALMLLCATGRKSRQRLRQDKCQVILKWAEMVEEQEDVSEKIATFLEYLQRDVVDAAAKNASEEQDNDDNDELDTMAERKPFTSLQIGAISVNDDDFDNVD